MDFYPTATVVCPLCGGIGGFVTHLNVRACAMCQGTGRNPFGRQTQMRLAALGRGASPPALCPTCQGSGQTHTTEYEACLMCQHTGRIPA